MKYQEIDSYIQSGQFSVANHLIMRQLDYPKRLHRQDLVILAEFAKRTGEFYLGLRLFKTLIEEKSGAIEALSDVERILFASLQTRIGAPQKSIELLRPVADTVDGALMTRAFAHVYMWEYSQSIPLFEKRLESVDPESYQYAIGQINLLAGQAFTLNHSTPELFEKAFANFKRGGWDLLMFNALEIMAGYSFNCGELDRASKFVFQASQIGIAKSHHRYQIFLDKWRFALKWMHSSDRDGLLLDFQELSRRANEAGLWNTVREIYYLLSHILKNQEMMSYLHIGSPYSEYRKQIELRNGWFQPQRNCQVNYNGQQPTRVFDMDQACEKTNRDCRLKPASISHRILKYLNYDFFKVMPKGELYYYLYPGQYFDPTSSNRKLYVGVQRLRKWLQKQSIPIEVSIEKNRVSLAARAQQQYGFVITSETHQPAEKKTADRDFTLKVHCLRERAKKTEVTNKDLQQILKIQRSAATKFLRKGLEAGLFTKQRRGKEVLYKFVA